MKRILLSLCLIACGLSVFSQEITLKGSVANANESTLYLGVFENGDFVKKEEIKVQSGKFTFSYKYGKYEIGCISVDKSLKHPKYIFFEDAEISIKATLIERFGLFRILNIKGGVLNEKYYEYENNRIDYIRKQKKENGIRVSGMSLTKKFIEENNKNILGLFEIYNLSKEPRYLKKYGYLFENLPEELKQYKLYNDFQTNYNQMKSITKGSKAVNFKIKTLEGKKLTLADFKGKVLVIDFWASWCGPCCKELPYMKQLYDKYHSKGLEIIGVSLDGKRENWIKAIEKYNLNWHNYSELKKWDCELAKKYMVQGIPYNVVIDKNGNIVAKGLHGERLERTINKELK